MSLTHRITRGHLARHVPQRATVGTEFAVLDIAQDFLLADLHRRGVLDGLVVFKGGTALRKHFSGATGRFSIDLDFAMASIADDRAAVATLLAEAIDGTSHESFRFSASEHRGRWTVTVDSNLVPGLPLPTLKLDVAPPTWLSPAPRPFVPTKIHDRYDFDLPDIAVIQLTENLAEKIARLTRVSTARDAADLCWAATTTPYSNFERALVRQLAILKIWVDNHGLDGHWAPADRATAFDPTHWLRRGRDWDDEQIGLLTNPPPSLEELEAALVAHYHWLADLTDDQHRWASCDPSDRADVVDAISDLPGSSLTAEQIWATH